VTAGQEIDSGETDVLLIFPPQTEAIFFPYLSLPYLTGHLRRQGRRVYQADLNIALLHDALRHPRLLTEAAQAQERTGVGGWYRQTMAEVITAHIDEIRGHVLRKDPTDRLGPARCVRLAHHAIALLVRDTFLVRMWQDLDQLDRDTRQAITRAPATYGIAVVRLHEMVTALLKRHTHRRFELTHLGRSTIFMIATQTPDSDDMMLTITAGTTRPVRFEFDRMPDAETLQHTIDLLPDDVWFDDPNGTPDHRRHLAKHFAEQIRTELGGQS